MCYPPLSDGVKGGVVNLINENVKLSWTDILLEALKRSGACGADLLQSVHTDISYERLGKRQEILILSLVPVSVFLLVMLSWFLEKKGGTAGEISQSVALLAIFLGGGNRFIRGIKDLILRRTVTVDVFVSIALIATMAIGEFISAAIVIFIMAVSGAVEGYTMDKSKRSIQNFLSMAPKTAVLLEDGKETQIDADTILLGDQLVVKPGERIPADGMVAEGFADVNEALVTGEAMPVLKTVGSEVFAGTLNEDGRIVMKVTKEPQDTVFSQIFRMVDAAQNEKAPIQKTVDRFTAWCLPIILVATAIGYLLTHDMHSAVSILLVAAPCALAIGTPTAVSAAMSNMTKQGVLIKGGSYFEEAGKLDVLMLDKTGTLTTGIPAISRVWTAEGIRKDDALYWAASAEQDSPHPFAKALKKEAEKKQISFAEATSFTSMTGAGIQAVVEGKTVDVGKPSYIKNLCSFPSDNIERVLTTEKAGQSSVAVAVDGCLYGLFFFEDQLREDVGDSVKEVQQMLGKDRVILLSGDRQKTAESFGNRVGIEKVFGDLMPEDKARFVETYQKQGKRVCMVGDGINDAPALAKASIGVAMGRSGTEFASETADVILMHEDLSLLAEFIDLSRRVVRRIKWNIFFSVIFNLTGILLGNLGLLTPVLAIILQEAGTITVLISSTLLLRRRPKRSCNY